MFSYKIGIFKNEHGRKSSEGVKPVQINATDEVFKKNWLHRAYFSKPEKTFLNGVALDKITGSRNYENT